MVFLSGCLFSCISVHCCLLNCFFLTDRNVKMPASIALIVSSLQPKLLSRFCSVKLYFKQFSLPAIIRIFQLSLICLRFFLMIIHQIAYGKVVSKSLKISECFKVFSGPPSLTHTCFSIICVCVCVYTCVCTRTHVYVHALSPSSS